MEFEQALREATTSLGSRGLGPQTTVIGDMRRALAGRVSPDEFDDGLRRLRAGAVVFEAHSRPDLLSPLETRQSLQEGEALWYLLRWLS